MAIAGRTVRTGRTPSAPGLRSALLIALWTGASGLVATSPAHAFSASPSIVLFNHGNDQYVGSTSVITITNGIPFGGVVLDGSVDETDWTVIFEIQLSSQSAFGLEVFVQRTLLSGTGLGISGAGILSGGASNLGLAAPCSPLATGGDSCLFEGFAPGDPSAQFFVSMADLDVGQQLALFNGSRFGADLGTFYVLADDPEASTALLAGLGLIGLGIRSRRDGASAIRFSAAARRRAD